MSTAPQPARTGTLAAPVKSPILVAGREIGATTLPPGTRVDVLKEEGGRLLVKARAGETWVGSAVVNVQEPTETAQMAPAGKTASSAKLPPKKVVLHRGLTDSSKNHHDPTLEIPEGAEVELVENIPDKKLCVIKYNGVVHKVDSSFLDPSLKKMRRTFQRDAFVYVLIAPPETELDVVDDSDPVFVLVKSGDAVYKVRHEELAPFQYTAGLTQELVAAYPGRSAAEGEPVQWFPDSQIIPGRREKRPEVLWEKAMSMEYDIPSACRAAIPGGQPRSSVTTVWDMIAAFNEAIIPPWLWGNWRARGPKGPRDAAETAWRERYKDTVGIAECLSLRQEFARWDAGIKDQSLGKSSNLALAVQDALEYLWSKRVGFAVKADAGLIQRALAIGYDRWIKENKQGTAKKPATDAPVYQDTCLLGLDDIAKDGGFSVLSPESKAKIPQSTPPRLVSRELSLGCTDFMKDPRLSPEQMKNGLSGRVPIQALLVDELKIGSAILATGCCAIRETKTSPDKIQSLRDGPAAYPYPKNVPGVRVGAWLITGYYLYLDPSAFGKTGALFWEIRQNWGSDYADHGYAYIPSSDLFAYGAEILSLSLEQNPIPSAGTPIPQPSPTVSRADATRHMAEDERANAGNAAPRGAELHVHSGDRSVQRHLQPDGRRQSGQHALRRGDLCQPADPAGWNQPGSRGRLFLNRHGLGTGRDRVSHMIPCRSA